MERGFKEEFFIFYLPSELRKMGFKSLGDNVLISRKSCIYHAERISIGNNVRIEDYCILSAKDEISLGNYIHINCYSGLFASSKIIMKDFSGLSASVFLYTESDDYSGGSLTNPTVAKEFKPKYHQGPITLEKHVIIGTHSAVLPNVVIETGTAVGAFSLVTKSCDAWSIYVGAPAKKKGERSRDLLDMEAKLIAMEDKLCI